MEDLRASRLNPDAGSHPVTTDPVELKAVRRASDRSLERFPYFVWRYGERGRRFGTSDGAWLVTLLDDPEEVAMEQVDWLARVLASRGMPTLLLEAHLEILHEELAAAEGAPTRDHDFLLRAARMLRERRDGRIPPARAAALAEDFVRRVPPPFANRARHMGPLLVAAVADEAAGIGRAVESLTQWAADPERFSPEWMGAVRDLLAQAGEAVDPAPG